MKRQGPPAKASTVTAAEAGQAWRDPEFWGPKGLGCVWCHEEPPIVSGLPFATGALGWRCLQSRFEPWGEERVLTWLGRQRGVYLRQIEREAALAAYRKGDLTGIEGYHRKYGVDLVAA